MMSTDANPNLAALGVAAGTALWSLWRLKKTSKQEPQYRRVRAQLLLIAATGFVAATAIGVGLFAAKQPLNDGRTSLNLPVFDTLGSRRILDSVRASESLDSLSVESKVAQREIDSLSRAAGRHRQSNDSMVVGIRLASRGRLRAAITKYDAALKVDSSNATAYGYKGYSQFRLKEYDSAIATMRKGIALDPTEPWSYYNFSLPLWAKGDTAAAVQALERAVRLNPSFRGIIKEDHQFDAFRSSRRFTALMGG